MDEELERFILKLKQKANRNADLYDGFNSKYKEDIDTWIRYTAEELGEVCTAVSRDRWLQAEYECLDLAHCAFMLYMAIKPKCEESP